MMIIRELGVEDYLAIWQKMKRFTEERTLTTQDECWMLEHTPVYTQGVRDSSEFILNPSKIPVVQSDRGGYVTYHGPGQLVVYFMVDLRRTSLGIRTFVKKLESILIELLKAYGITGELQCNAPGVYVKDKKIASIGLRVKNGCTYHGVALNVGMNLEPFFGIHPCGFKGLQMTEMKAFAKDISVLSVRSHLKDILEQHFPLPSC